MLTTTYQVHALPDRSSRSDIVLGKANLYIIAFSLTIMNIPMLAPKGGASSIILKLLKYALLWWPFIIAALNKHGIQKLALAVRNNKRAWYFIGFLALHYISYLRTYLNTVLWADNAYQFFEFGELASTILGLTTITFFGLSIFLICPAADFYKNIKALLLSPPIYVTVVVLLHLVGVENVTDMYGDPGSAVLAEHLGLRADRVYFPMAPGINVFGMIASAAILCAICILIFPQFKRIEKTIVAACSPFCLYALLCSDSRGGLIAVLLALSVTLLAPRKITCNVIYLILLIPLYPVVSQRLIQYIPDFIWNLLARKGGTTLLNGRNIVWEPVIDKLSHFSPAHLFGFGAYGQVNAHIVDYYLFLFYGIQSDNRLMSSNVHNFGLQEILDHGYIGYTAIVLFMIYTFKIIINNINITSSSTWKTILILYLYTLFLGLHEVSPTPNFVALFSIFTLICITTIRNINTIPTNNNRKTRTPTHSYRT